MKVWRSIAALTAATLALAGATAVSAQAITGGDRDDANHYANVGMIVFYEDGGRFRCTATLVSPTVLLTAAHCTAGTAGKTIVNFSPVIAEEPPSGIPAAADPAAGYTDSDADGVLVDAKGRQWLSLIHI